MRLTDTEFEGKHGELSAISATQEMLDSSKTVLQTGRNGKTIGLQQWFTPKTIAHFVAAVVGEEAPVLDLTAGSGKMLSYFDKDRRCGIEVDPTYAKPKVEPDYAQISGDAQKAVPMLRAAGVQFPAIAINPPYGLTWQDAAHGKHSSTLMAYLWAQDLLTSNGQGAMLCGTDRLAREVMGRPEAKGIYAVVDFPGRDVWESVALPVSLAFFVSNRNLGRYYEPKADRIRLERTMDTLTTAAKEITDARGMASQYVRRSTFHPAEAKPLLEAFDATRREYDRRRTAQEKGQAKVTHDLSLKKNKIVSTPSAYARILLANEGHTTTVKLLHHQHVNYFAQNSRAWEEALSHEKKGYLTISPQLKERVAEVMADREKTATPLFPVTATMRLGWLTDLTRIKCIKGDADAGLVEGNLYGIATAQKVEKVDVFKPYQNRDGEQEQRKFEHQRKLLSITITDPEGQDFTNPKTYDESEDNINYMAEHFEIPDPGDVATRFPELYKKMRDLLTRIEERRGFRLKAFQKDHLARLLIKGRGMLAHEQGLGKTLMLMTLAEAQIELGCAPWALIASPQDLIPQWGREAWKFFGRRREDLKGPLDLAKNVFGRELVEIRTPHHARQVRAHIKGVRNRDGTWRRKPAEEGGWFITYYEALSQVGKTQKTEEVLPHVYLDHRRSLDARLEHYKSVKAAKKAAGVEWNVGAFREARIPVLPTQKEARPKKPEKTPYSYYGDEPEAEEVMTSRWACPRCLTDTAAGWTGEVCRREPADGFHGCGYVHRRRRRRPAYAYLTDCFIDGVVCVDELSEMRGESQKSQALRGLARGNHKYGGTGTPMSNYIPDAFWGMWWTLGNATAAFPYDYREGKTKFEEDFAVIEYLMGREDSDKANQRQNRKVLPRITNVSQFWRLTQPSISRCRKEQTGEPLVPRTLHPYEVPLGVAQKQQQDFWMVNFPDYFTEMNPDHKLVELDLVERFEAKLGKNWRLEFASTMPNCDKPTMTWQRAKDQDWWKDVSPWTPANLKVLELAAEHAARGEKVLIGSGIIATGPWIAEQLNAKGIKAVHMTDEDAEGNASTQSPKKRAAAVTAFTDGDTMVMCAGVNAMKLGHNLDKASTVIVHGLPYSHMVMDQFIARVHRLTSKKPVNVHVIVPRHSIAEQKWQLLKDKQGAADLAFDGELMEQDEEEKNLATMLQEMKAKGIRPQDDEIEESQIEESWRNFVYTPTVVLPPASSATKKKEEATPAARRATRRHAKVRQPIPNGPLPKYTPRVVPKPPIFANPSKEERLKAYDEKAAKRALPYDIHTVEIDADGNEIARKDVTPRIASKPDESSDGYEPPNKLPAQQEREEAALERKEATAAKYRSFNLDPSTDGLTPSQKKERQAELKKRQKQRAKHKKQDTSLFEMDPSGEVTYEQDSLFDVA